MNIEYYPDYWGRGILLLNPKSLMGVMIEEESISQIALFSAEGVELRIPDFKVPENTLHSPPYHVLEMKPALWGGLDNSAFQHDINLARSYLNDLSLLFTNNTPSFFKVSNNMYERRQIMIV